MSVKWSNVETIAYFGYDGVIKPLRVRLKENGNVVVLNIDNIISIEKKYTAGYISYVYDCNAVVFNRKKNFKIRFISDDNLWEMGDI